jgi:hypothetical protein
MSAPAPFPRTPEPEQGDIRRYLPPPRDPTWTASWPSPTATGTIVPPAPAEPTQPAPDRTGATLNALRAARRNALTTLEWIQHAIDQAEKAEAGK